MRCRKNVKNMTQAEKDRFVRAINKLKQEDSTLHPGQQSRYDDYAEIHREAMNPAHSDWTHGNSAFFPWHRELLYRFENELRALEPGTTIPYWDWTRDQAAGDAGFPFTHSFIGVDGNPGNQDRVERDPAFAAAANYPYEFDPDNWPIVVKDGGEPDFLTRDFASRADAPTLPENDSGVVGTPFSFRGAIGVADYLTLRQQSESIHNLVHRWVTGNMITASSPNDPVFFLHHAAIDRMWTLWQEKNPGTTPYVHTDGLPGHGLNDQMIFNLPGDPAPWSGTATPNQVIDHHAMHGDGVWYESDLPEITLDSGSSLAFGQVPEGMTQYRAVRFRIESCRQVRFRIIGPPTGNFGLTPFGDEFIVEPDLDADFVNGLVFVQFQANGAAVQNSSVTIEAYIIDGEGYYAATEGGVYSLGTYSVNLSASIIPRENNAVVLVLDRSYSMSAAAGGGSTRSQLLKSAVGVFHDLLLPNDEIGIVSFDDVTEDLLPMTTQSAGLGTTLTGTGLDPRGNTAIGQGILAGNVQLAAATHTNLSMLVLTDGNQNVTPYVENLPAGTITNRTFAIGFGLPGQVSDGVLNTITQNTGGDLIITGELPTAVERFQLTKYFVQVLAGATSANVILDPQGELTWESQATSTFYVAETEIELDVIALSPLPGLLDFALRTPGGEVITPAVAAAEPNISYHVGQEVAFYRLSLPALPSRPEQSHAGQWEVRLKLKSPEEIKEWLAEHQIGGREVERVFRRGVLPYSFVVHTRSNLDFQAACTQESLEPGSPLQVSVSLNEYGVPFGGSASVWVELTAPDGTQSQHSLTQIASGRYAAGLPSQAAGLYQLRVRASGSSSGGYPFMREKNLAVGLYAGADRQVPGLDGWLDDLRERDRMWCELLACLLSDRVLAPEWVERLKESGIDLDGLRACVKRICARRERPLEAAPSAQPAAVSAAQIGLIDTLLRRQLAQLPPETFFRRAEGAAQQPSVAEAVQAADKLRAAKGAFERELFPVIGKEDGKQKGRKKK